MLFQMAASAKTGSGCGRKLLEVRQFLIVSVGPSNDVSVFKADTLDAVKTIPVGARPWGIAVIPLK